MTCNMVRLLCYHLSLFVTRMSMLERVSYCLISVGVVIEKTSFTELTLSQTYCSTDKKGLKCGTLPAVEDDHT